MSEILYGNGGMPFEAPILRVLPLIHLLSRLCGRLKYGLKIFEDGPLFKSILSAFFSLDKRLEFDSIVHSAIFFKKSIPL